MTYYNRNRKPAAVVTITTEEREFLADSASWSDFAASLYQFALKRNGLTAKQASAMRSMKAKIEARRAAKSEVARDSQSVDMIEGFDALYSGVYTAVEGGLKRPTLRVGPLTLSWAHRPRNPANKDHVYVRFRGEYRGKINSDGEFFPFKLAGEERDECLAEMRECCGDFLMKLLAYGRETGNCGVCGKVLTDESSIADGIGPVCKTRMKI